MRPESAETIESNSPPAQKKGTNADTIKSMIGHSLATFKITDKAKIDVNIDTANTED
jgi:hypothetical protein